MENAPEYTKRLFEYALSIKHLRQTENSFLKEELEGAKLSVESSMLSHEFAMTKEQMAFKRAKSWESQKNLFLDELEEEKHKLSNLLQELDKEKNLQSKVQDGMEHEKQNIIARATCFRKEREQFEESTKSEEDMIRKKAANDLQKYVEDIAKLEKELSELKGETKHEKNSSSIVLGQ